MEARRFQMLFPGYSQETLQFLNRTTGITRRDADLYAALIDGLVTDGVWSLLDVLYIFAAADKTNALINLKQSSFGGTANGGPAFAAYGGYTGVDASTTVYIDTGFNPLSASSPNFAGNSRHLSAWSNSSAASSGGGGYIIGSNKNSTGGIEAIAPRYSDGNSYYGMEGAFMSVANASALGHYITDRSGASATAGYKNGVSVVTSSAGTVGISNTTMYALNIHDDVNGATQGSGCQIAAASMGGDVSGNALNFYNRLRTFMTAVGIP